MSRIRPLLGMAAMTAIALSGGAAAQGRADRHDPALDAARSRAIQARLAYIEEHKAAFVKDLLEGWVPFVDHALYDPFSLYDIAMRAPAWQVYGAWLTGGYRTMIDVLRGQTGASQFIRSLDAPQAKQFASASANLGETSSQLVFRLISPCRMVDTRGTGARTGPLAAGSTRVFDLTTSGYAEGQGGQTSGCTGLPAFSHYGRAVNITVADYTANGGLQVYPFGGAIPATSIINFFPGAYALANNGTVTGCYSCSDDITVRAFGSATHVIIDVMGYFERAQATLLDTSTPQYFIGPLVTVPGDGGADVLGTACPAGTILINGANIAEPGTAIYESRRFTKTVWGFRMRNLTSTAKTAQAWSLCIDQPVRAVP